MSTSSRSGKSECFSLRGVVLLSLPLLVSGCMSGFEAGQEAARRGEGPGVMGIIGFIVLGLLVFAFVKYCMMLRRTLYRCGAKNRAVSPELTWLLLVPVVGFVWHFVIVLLMHKTLTAELTGKREHERLLSARTKGLVMCGLPITVVIPILGGIAVLVAVFLWMSYWKEISALGQLINGPSRSSSEEQPIPPAQDIRFHCHACNQSLEAPAELQGQSIPCPACNALLTVPPTRNLNEASRKATEHSPEVPASSPQSASPAVDTTPASGPGRLAVFAGIAAGSIVAIISLMIGGFLAQLLEAARLAGILYSILGMFIFVGFGYGAWVNGRGTYKTVVKYFGKSKQE